MATRGGLFLVALAAAAAALMGRKKKDGSTSPLQAHEVPPDMEPHEAMPPPASFPHDWYNVFMSSYKEAVDECVAELGLVDPLDIRACSLVKIFPGTTWPPPKNAYQWQRNLWYNKDLFSYIQSKYPPIL